MQEPFDQYFHCIILEIHKTWFSLFAKYKALPKLNTDFKRIWTFVKLLFQTDLLMSIPTISAYSRFTSIFFFFL